MHFRVYKQVASLSVIKSALKMIYSVSLKALIKLTTSAFHNLYITRPSALLTQTRLCIDFNPMTFDILLFQFTYLILRWDDLYTSATMMKFNKPTEKKDLLMSS